MLLVRSGTGAFRDHPGSNIAGTVLVVLLARASNIAGTVLIVLLARAGTEAPRDHPGREKEMPARSPRLLACEHKKNRPHCVPRGFPVNIKRTVPVMFSPLCSRAILVLR